MADDSENSDKPKKGLLKKAFGFAAKAVLWTLPVTVCASLIFDPTWLLIFHNEQNIMAQAFIQTMEPYTSWLPEMVGLKGEDGLFYPLMKSFVSEKYNAIVGARDDIQSSGMEVDDDNSDELVSGLAGLTLGG